MANNEYVNKVVYGGNVLIDLSLDTLTEDDADKVLAPNAFHAKSGAPMVGTIPTKGAATYNVSANDQTITAKQYLGGAQIIRGVALTDGAGSATIRPANVRDGVTIQVGDSGDSDRILSVEGTFTDRTTVTGTGIAAAGAEHILSGYAAFMDGAQVNGSIPSKGAATYNVSSSNQTIAAGQYLSGAQTIRAVTTAGISAANVKDGVTVKVGDANDDDRIVGVTGTFTDHTTVTGTNIAAASANEILAGYAAFMDGAQVDGTIPTKAATTYNVSASNQTISSGQYLGGTQTFRGVTTTGISAANIKHNVVVKVGDAADDDRITGVTGTFTKASTVSTGQTAATASQMLSGYSAWVDGAEVKGNIETKTSANMTVSGATVTAPAGYYATAASKSVASGSATTPTSSITITPSISVANDGLVTVTGSASKSITPTVSAGYVTTGTAGTVSASSNGTLQLSAPTYVDNSLEATILGSLSVDADTGLASVAFLKKIDGVDEFSDQYSEIYGSESAVNPGWLTEVNIQGPKFSSSSAIVLESTSAQLPIQAAATITPTESSQTAVAKGKWTTGAVTVAAIPSNYVGSGITRRSSSDLTASGATVTVPAGYYSAQATKTIANGSAKTPATTVTANPTFTFNSATGVVTATASASQSVTPTVTAGYVSSGTAGTITVSGSNTYTVTASELTYGKTTVRDYGEGPIAFRGTFVIGTGYATMRTLGAAKFSNVATTGKTYVDISETTEAPVLVSGSYLFIDQGYVDDLKISLAKLVPDGASADLASNKILQGYSAYDNAGALIAGSIPSKTAQTYTPTTSDQTIAAGQYLSGAQTVKGDANLIAANIKQGVQLFGITGTHAGGQISYTETDNDAGGKTVTIVFTGDD